MTIISNHFDRLYFTNCNFDRPLIRDSKKAARGVRTIVNSLTRALDFSKKASLEQALGPVPQELWEMSIHLSPTWREMRDECCFS